MSPIVIPFLFSHHEIVGIIEDAPRTKLSKFKSKLFKLIEMIQYLNKKKSLTLKKFCKKKHIPYQYLDKSSSVEIEKWLANLGPDLIVVYSMSHLLDKNIFSMPRYGSINLHPSLLPSYRGPNPYFWIYYYLETKSGVTVHYIDEGEDTGDIIFQEKFEIQLGLDFSSTYKKTIIELGTPLLIKAVDTIEKGVAPRSTQPKNSPTIRAKNLSNEEYNYIIGWNNWDVRRVWHLLRGFSDRFDLIEAPGGIFKGQRWMIGDYCIGGINGYEIGKIYKIDLFNSFIVASNGFIYLKLSFDFKKTLSYIITHQVEKRLSSIYG